MSRPPSIAVIGGGVAGCSAAWHLMQSGHFVELFEKEPFIGGRTHTCRDDGLTINTGAGFYTNFYPLLHDLIPQLELSDEVIRNSKETVLSDGQQRYAYQVSSVLSFLRMPWLTWRDKLRVIRLTLGLLRSRKQFDLVDPTKLAAWDDESIKDYAVNQVGHNAYIHLIRTAIEPYWYFACEDASAAMLMALQAEASGAEFFSLKSGMDLVADRLIEEVRHYLDEGVNRLSKSDQGKYRLETERGDHDNEFDGVVVATQAHQAERLVRELPSSDVSDDQRSYLQTQKYAANINVLYRMGEIDPGDNGFQLSPVGSQRHGIAGWTDLGVLNRAELPDEERVVAAYLLDEFSKRLLGESDECVASEVWKSIRKFNQQFPEHHPQVVKMTRRRHAIPIPEVGRYKVAARFQQQQKPPIVFAGDYLATATVEGALRTGKLAAEQFCKLGS